MRYVRFLLAVFLAGASTGAAPTEPEAGLFIVHFSTGPAWEAERPFHEQPYAAEHSRNLRHLREAGDLLLGARYADQGMIVLRAADEAAARALVERDPAVRAEVFQYRIDRFHPFYGGCVGPGC